MANNIPAQIALLDADGVIVSVNEAWKSFARENGYAAGDLGIGTNYVSICLGVSDEGRDHAGEVAKAYLQVPELRGFERFCTGRAAEDMPNLTARICGVCPEAHHMGSTKALEKLRTRDEFSLLEGVHDEVIERHKAPLALGTILVVVLLAALGLFPISVLALGGAAFLVMTGVLTARDAYRSIDWAVLVLIAGMIALGHAMDKTGALELAANNLHAVIGPWGKHATLWVFYFMTAALSLLILNKPAAVLCAPLGVQLARQLECSAEPFIMAVAFAAATAMATPMGYQTNLLVYGPGGYRFTDFVKIGLPMVILSWILATLMIPRLFPF